MRILYLISSKGYFGAENVLVQLVSEVGKQSFIQPVVGVIVNPVAPHKEVADICLEKNIQAVTFMCCGKIDFHTIVSIKSYVENHRIDIVHSHGYKANLYSFFATIKNSTVKRVATCHNWLNGNLKMKAYTVLDKLFLRRFDCIVPVSEDVESKIISAGVNRGKIRRIDNGIAVHRMQKKKAVANLKNDLGLPSNSIVIGTVGRISKEKGHCYLLAAALDIIKDHPNVFFLIVGDGALKGHLEKEYKSSHIIFTGIRKDIENMYSCMDIFILPSLAEGLPMVLLEAMAYDLPVIASGVGAIPKIIQNYKTGLLIKPGETGDIHRALIFLVEHPEQARQMASRGSRKIRTLYSSSRMAAEYMVIYRQLHNKDLIR